jgi:hypothetical protein
MPLRMSDHVTPAGDPNFNELNETYTMNTSLWECSTNMSLKIMKGSISERITGTILDSTDAKKYMASI